MHRLVSVMCVLSLAAPVGAVAVQAPAAAELVQQGRALERDGKLDGALVLYEKAAAADAQSFDAHMALGRVLDLLGRYADARRHLTTAIALAAPEARNAALAAMAVSYAFESNAAEASKYYQQVFDNQMSSQAHDAAAATANALGRVYLESGDPDNAHKWYETGYQTAGRIAGLSQDEQDLWTMRWHHAQARIAARRGNRAEADKHAAALEALIGKNDANRKEMPIHHYLAGYLALYGGDPDAAIRALSQGDQDDPFIQGLIAQAYEKKGDTASARRHHERVLASTAHNINSAFSRPRARQAAGR